MLEHVDHHKLRITSNELTLKGLSQLEAIDTACVRCQYEEARELQYEESKYRAYDTLELVYIVCLVQSSIHQSKDINFFIWKDHVCLGIFHERRLETWEKFIEFEDKAQYDCKRR